MLLFSSCKKEDYSYKNLKVSKEDIPKWVCIVHEYNETDGATSCITTIESQKSIRTFTIKSTVTWNDPLGFLHYKVITYPLEPKEVVSFTTEDVDEGSVELTFVEIFKHV